MKERIKYIFKKDAILFCTCLLPTTISLICTQQSAKNYIKTIISTDSFLYSQKWQITIIILVCIIIPVLSNTLFELCDVNKNAKMSRLFNTILSSIQDCVDSKKTRFYTEYTKHHTTASTIFLHITQPIEQLKRLCSGLLNVLSTHYKIDDIKGSIIKCSNNEMIEFLVLCRDDQPSINIADLNVNNSMAKEASNTNKISIIENTDLSNTFYKPTGCKVKSAICFPVKRGTQTILLVCFTSKHTNAFKKEYEKEYETIFNHFQSRILLESYLLDLKQRIHE